MTTQELTLPPVAKSVYLPCKKCNEERYHKVLAHKNPTSAKVKCEVCGSQKTYTLPKPKKEKPQKVLGPSSVKASKSRSEATKMTPSSGAGASSKRNSSKAEQYEKEYFTLLAAAASGAEKPYKMSEKFSMNEKLNHSRFGIGIVRTVQNEKIEVLFKDEIRVLVHNRV